MNTVLAQLQQDYPHDSIRMLAEALVGAGYQIKLLELDTTEYLQATNQKTGKSWITTLKNVSYPTNSVVFSKISKNKSAAYDLAKTLDVPIPETLSIVTGQEPNMALLTEFINKHNTVITKPMDSAGSKGVTLGIQTLPKLEVGVKEAQLLSDKVLVQEQVDGEEVRLMVVGGRLCAALHRQQPQIIGDGVSTTEELIKQENANRKKVDSLIPYRQLDETLIDPAFIKSQDVPAENQKVVLGTGSMVSTGASIWNIIDTLHPSYIAMAEKVACSVGAGVLSVDLLVHDYTTDASNGAWFLETNTSPSLRMYYCCRDQTDTKVIEAVVDHIDTYSEMIA